jgi:2-furoyl-CoA dehydrogenase large subunit
VSGRYQADITLSELDAPRALTLNGVVVGALGNGRGSGRIRLAPTDGGGTLLTYEL